jgi:hypothetical protein
MSRPAEYSLQVLWFSILDRKGKARTAGLAGVKWLGEWPLSEDVCLQLLDDPIEWDALKARYRHPGRLSQSVLARFAELELKRRGGVACNGMSFSRTHSQHLAVVLGFEGESCGVDLEVGAQTGRPLRVALRYLSEPEKKLVELSGLSPWAVWCAKEALSKALGTGLEAPIGRYEVHSLESGVVGFKNFPDWSAWAWDLGDAHLALCVPFGDPAQPAGVLQWFLGWSIR